MDASLKSYKKMMNKYKKLLRNHAKEAAPWDYLFGLDYFVDFLRFMQEYYKLGVNVWAFETKYEGLDEFKDWPTRYESISKAIEYYDKWQNASDDYIKIVYTEKECKHYQRLGWHLYETSKEESWYELIKYDNYQDVNRAIHVQKLEYKHKFFETVEKFIEEWWD